MYVQVAVSPTARRRKIARFTIHGDGQLVATGADSERVHRLLRLMVYDPASQAWVTSELDPVAWVKWLSGKLCDPRGAVARLDRETAAALDVWATQQLKDQPQPSAADERSQLRKGTG